MNKFLKGCLVFGLIAAFGAAMPQQSEAKEKKILIRISHTGSEGNEFTMGYEKFKELLEKKTNGRVVVRIYPNAVLGSDRVAGEAVQQGNLEVASIATNILSSFHKSALAFDMPYMCDPEKMIPYMKALAYGDLNKYLVEQLATVDLYPFMFNATAMRSWAFTSKDVKSVEDLKGVKIRSTPSPIDIANCKAVGMNPTALAFDAVYQALQQGTVEGELLSFLSMKSFGRAEILKYMYVTQHNFPIHIGCMSKKFYDSLPADIQQAVMESAKEAQEWEWTLLDQLEKEGLEYCNQNGVKVNFLDDAQKAALKEKFKVVWDEFGPQLDPKMVQLLQDAQK
ncbi:TRAP transporter substrate-binding protein [Mailhella massiliensis]|uniref:TRAP transporter substrate-binding protein n=1 Tax=Mailhella massiliensis TaxID=1903261 RepID=UPI002357FD5A|nr:TRAP transporter substrate-binding protein [Mailhella massiliensis]